VTYETPGTYKVTLEATNAFGANELIIDEYITVYDDPVSLYDYTERGVRINFKNESEQFGSFLWEFGDGATSTEFEPSHLYNLPGTYEVTLSVNNECGIDTYVREVSVRHRDISFVTVAPPPVPNPTGGLVTVSFTGQPASEISILVSGLNGQYDEVLTQNFESGKLSTSLDLGYLENGTYMIFFKTEHEVKMSKVVIQK
jgi:PKD repeat protein